MWHGLKDAEKLSVIYEKTSLKELDGPDAQWILAREVKLDRVPMGEQKRILGSDWERMSQPIEEMTRLYRAEPIERGQVSDWVKQGQIDSGHAQAEGRWFVANPAMLEWYREDAAGPSRTIYIDVPTDRLESFRVSNSSEQIGHRPVKSYSRDPENEFFLPRDLVTQAKIANESLGVDPYDPKHNPANTKHRQAKSDFERDFRQAKSDLTLPDAPGRWHALDSTQKLSALFGIPSFNALNPGNQVDIVQQELDLTQVPEHSQLQYLGEVFWPPEVHVIDPPNLDESANDKPRRQQMEIDID